ncbi:MAG: N-acetylneuraminate synthase family protein [Alphaproteobacteria bacterium]|nr:N-acetylneuraminate synthase family protein [Alphaproteobacteria bacterium]
MRCVQLGKTVVGNGRPIYVIAEIGGNFTTFPQAKNLIDMAFEAGANAVKLQTFRAETISSRKAMYDMPNTGKASQFELFKKFEIDFALHKDIWDYCREKDIFVFSTPSHITDIELLEKIGCQAYKIGSDDLTNIPFLKQVADVGKPIVLSTGMSTMAEVQESVSAILGQGNPDLILMHCVTNYPSETRDANLLCIPELKRNFGLPVGYSDHVLGPLCCQAAAAIGANLLEKHFTYNKMAEGPDHMLSADQAELQALIRSVRLIEEALGDGIKRPAAGELKTRRNNRKSIVATMDIQSGSALTKENLAIKRPGHGIPPKYLDQIVGNLARRDIKAEDPLEWGDV